jgi:cystathionine beta-lyase
MIYNFDVCPDRRKSESEKWHHYPEDVLPLWVADMDFVSPEPVRKALCERVEHGVFGYPGCPAELLELIVTHIAKQYHWRIQVEDILLLPGVVGGFNLACQTLRASGDGEVIVQTPVYPPIRSAPENTGLTRIEFPLTQGTNGRYFINLDAFERALTDQTRLFLLCNPHNPVGRVFTREELTCMAEICLRHGVTICSDEIHCDILYPGYRHLPIASLDPEIAAHTITLMAPSKTYNIAGLHFSFAIIQNPELRKQVQKVSQGLFVGSNIFGMAAAEAAYRDGQEWLAQVLKYLQANRDYLVQTIQRDFPGVRVFSPEGTFLAWLDCRKAGLDNPYEFFLENAKVALNDGLAFGEDGRGFVRLNFGCPRFILEEALNRMKTALMT